MTDLFNTSSGLEDDGYVAFLIKGDLCSEELAQDIEAYLAFREMAQWIRQDFEGGTFGCKIVGPCGTFDGVLPPEGAEGMPNYWRETEEKCAGRKIYVPDARHPLGGWLKTVAERLLPLPSLDVLDAVLRRHGIEGSKAPLPVLKEHGDDWLVLMHNPKKKTFSVDGVEPADSLKAIFNEQSGL